MQELDIGSYNSGVLFAFFMSHVVVIKEDVHFRIFLCIKHRRNRNAEVRHWAPEIYCEKRYVSTVGHYSQLSSSKRLIMR